MKIRKGDIIQYQDNFIAKIIEVGQSNHRAEIIKLLKKGWYGEEVGHNLITAYDSEMNAGTCWIIPQEFKNSTESIKAKNGRKIECRISKI